MGEDLETSQYCLGSVQIECERTMAFVFRMLPELKVKAILCPNPMLQSAAFIQLVQYVITKANVRSVENVYVNFREGDAAKDWRIQHGPLQLPLQFEYSEHLPRSRVLVNIKLRILLITCTSSPILQQR